MTGRTHRIKRPTGEHRMSEVQIVEAELQSTGLIADVVADEQTFVDLRRQIHAHPETGFDGVNPAELVARLLKEWGYDVHTGIGGTGVVGQLKLGNGTRKIGIRADMDALPI